MDSYYSTMSVILGIILVAILLESIRVVMRGVRRKLFLGQASIKVDVLPMTVEKERRRHQKVNIKWPVSVDFNGNSIKATARDISLGGAFVACDCPLPLQEHFSLSINVPGEKPVALNAEVVWSNSNVPADKVVNRGMGVKFVQNSEEDIEYLKNLVATCLHKSEVDQWIATEKKALEEEARATSSEPAAVNSGSGTQGLVVPARA
jgi:hypothetical protein